MKTFESHASNRGLIRCALVLACVATVAPGSVGSAEAGQSCGNLTEPQDRATISSPAQVPAVYLARVAAGDAEHLSNLFAPDAVFRGNGGVVLNGRDEIREFFGKILGDTPPKLAVGRSVSDDNRVAFEVVSLQGPCNEADPATALDMMDINADGQVEVFAVFTRPRPQ